MSRSFIASCLVWLLLVIGCGSTSSPSPAPAPAPAAPEQLVALDAGAAQALADNRLNVEPGPIAVTSDDPMLGDPLAPVTLVVFSDFECPYCQKLSRTIDELADTYGERRLRIVYKHFPLAFHKLARPAAEIGAAIHITRGNEAFWQYHDMVYDFGAKLDERALRQTVRSLGLHEEDLEAHQASAASKVDRDMDLGEDFGVRGTPATFVNGVFVSGAQSTNEFRRIIDTELVAAENAMADGIQADAMYAHRTKHNLENAPDTDTQPSAPSADETVWFVPIDGSVSKGPSDALVTLVIFSDFECPFCSRVLPTLETVEKEYGKDVRFVFKHNPLPFHKRARAAANFAIEAQVQRGATGFWEAHDTLFQNQKALQDADLEKYARELKLNPFAVMTAVKQGKHEDRIAKDQALSSDVQAGGTPHFFINGRRLVGAQPFEKFSALIDETRADAQKLVDSGTARGKVYETIMKDAKRPEAPETIQVPPAPTSAPSRGPKNAPVTIQVFSDFQCPFCQRLVPTLDDIAQKHPKDVRIVFRHLPLAMHKDAPLAHQAAIEAQVQLGDAGFWKMHDRLFEGIDDLKRPALDGHARALGLDMNKFAAALDGGVHQTRIDTDLAVADAAEIRGTPTSVVGQYKVSGAQPIAAFDRAIQHALKDAKGP